MSRITIANLTFTIFTFIISITILISGIKAYDKLRKKDTDTDNESVYKKLDATCPPIPTNLNELRNASEEAHAKIQSNQNLKTLTEQPGEGKGPDGMPAFSTQQVKNLMTEAEKILDDMENQDDANDLRCAMNIMLHAYEMMMREEAGMARARDVQPNPQSGNEPPQSGNETPGVQYIKKDPTLADCISAINDLDLLKRSTLQPGRDDRFTRAQATLDLCRDNNIIGPPARSEITM